MCFLKISSSCGMRIFSGHKGKEFYQRMDLLDTEGQHEQGKGKSRSQLRERLGRVGLKAPASGLLTTVLPRPKSRPSAVEHYCLLLLWNPKDDGAGLKMAKLV